MEEIWRKHVCALHVVVRIIYRLGEPRPNQFDYMRSDKNGHLTDLYIMHYGWYGVLFTVGVPLQCSYLMSAAPKMDLLKRLIKYISFKISETPCTNSIKIEKMLTLGINGNFKKCIIEWQPALRALSANLRDSEDYRSCFKALVC